MTKRTRSKETTKDWKTDPNFVFFFDTDARVSDTLCLDWARIYSIFGGDDFYELKEDSKLYENINKSGFKYHHHVPNNTLIHRFGEVGDRFH